MSTSDKIYGSRKYPFKTSGQEGKRDNFEYYTLVNEKTQRLEVKDKGLTAANDRSVGYYDLSVKPPKFVRSSTFFANFDKKERDFFASEAGLKQAQNAAIQGGIKEQVKEAGVNPVVARKQIKDLVKTGSTDIDPNDIDDVREVLAEEALRIEESKRGLGRSTFPKDLRYPETMSSKQDAIKFQVFEFIPRKFDSETPGVFQDRERQDPKKTLGEVVIAVPGGIRDGNSVSWGLQTMNPAEAVGAQIAMAALNTAVNEGDQSDELSSIISGVAGAAGSPGMNEAARSLIAGAAVGKGGELLTRTTGNVLNPNVELLFQKPNLREFQFVFNLSPRTPKEGSTIKKIIRLFKQASAARKTPRGIFLKSPFLFQLSYVNNAKNLNRFKPCALTSCSVDYTPNGAYSTFRDGVMTQYKLTLGFGEIDPIFNSDYDELDDTADSAGIGY